MHKRHALIYWRFIFGAGLSLLLSVLALYCAPVARAQTTQLPDVAAAALGARMNFTDEEQAWIAARKGVIRVGVPRVNWPPVDVIDATSTYQGMSADLLDLIAKRSNLKLNWVIDNTWAETLARAERGEVDLVPSLAKTADRGRYLQFTDPYLSSPTVMIVRRDVGEIAARHELGKLTIATERVTASYNLMRNEYPRATFLQVEDTLQALLSVARGDADAYTGILLSAEFLIQTHALINLEVRSNTRYPTGDLRFGVSSANSPLVSIINKGIATLTAADRAEIRQHWLSGLRRDINVRGELNLSPSEREWIEKHPIVEYAINPEFFPFSRRNANGKAEGMAVDYIDLIANATGLRFIPRDAISWRQAIDDTTEKKLDMLPTLVRTVQREKYLSFVGPYTQTQDAVIARRDGAVGGSGLSEFRNKRVAVDRGHRLIAYINKEFPDISVVETGSLRESLDAVADNKADAMVGNLVVISHLLPEYGNDLHVASIVDDGNNGLYFAVRNDMPELRSILYKAMTSFSDSDHAAIRQKWLALRVEQGVTKETLLRWGVPIGGALAAILGTIAFSNRRLRREIGRRREAEVRLRAARDEAEQATRAKSTFLATMSHEIRTPINAMLGTIDLLTHAKLAEPDRQSVSIIQNSANGLTNLLNDILDFSKIEAGKLSVTTASTALLPHIEHATSMFAPRAAEKGIALTLRVDPRLRKSHSTDGIRLRQVLTNLVSNAVKFTNHGSVAVVVDIVAETVDTQLLRVTVTDSGIGMRQAELEKLFQAFYQSANQHATREPGTGLGLAISKQITHMLGGTLELTSELGRGSVATLTLPLTIASTEYSFHHDGERANVAIMEDDPVDRGVILTYGRAANFNVTEIDLAGLTLNSLNALIKEKQLRAVMSSELALDHVGLTTLASRRLWVEQLRIRLVVLTLGNDFSLQSDGDWIDTLSKRPLIPSQLASITPLKESHTRSAIRVPDAIARLPLRVLLAEDHPTNRMVIERQLHLLGVEVDAVEDGERAWQLWRTHQHRVVVTDFQMPKMDGPSLSRHIREQESALPASIRTRIIGLTAAGTASDADCGTESGMDLVVLKPVSLNALRLALELPDVSTLKEPAMSANATVINLSLLRESLGDDSDINAMLRDYSKSQEADFAALTAAVQNRENNIISDKAHRIKGAARIIGAEHLAQTAQALESVSRTGGFAHLDRLLAAMQDANDAVSNEIRGVLSK
jgi:two-component system, NarL family, sensor histidine kinase EvgS